MKFKKILEAYFTYDDGEEVGLVDLLYPDSQVETSTYRGYVGQWLQNLYDKEDLTTRSKIADINWAQNYLSKTNNTDYTSRDFDQETVLIILKDGIIQFSYFSSRKYTRDGFVEDGMDDTIPHFGTILGGTEKYLGIRGYVKLQRLSLEKTTTSLEVFKECGSGYSVADLV